MKFKDTCNGDIFDKDVNDKIGVVFNHSIYLHATIKDVSSNSIILYFIDEKNHEEFSMDELNENNIAFYQVD